MYHKKVFEHPGNEVEVAQDMLNAECAYKRYAYKKTCSRFYENKFLIT